MVEVSAFVMFNVRLGTICFMEYVTNFHFPCFRHFYCIKAEKCRLPEANNNNTFTVLGNPMPPVNYTVINMVAQFFLQCSGNYFKCMTFVMGLQILHIFQDKFRPVAGSRP